MKLDYDKHIGEYEVRIDIHASVSPSLVVVFPRPIDAAELSNVLEEAMRCAALEQLDRLGYTAVKWSDMAQNILACTVSEPKFIKDADARKEDDRSSMVRLSEAFAEGDAQREQAAKENPDNGKKGIWHVQGMRHSCYVFDCSSAPEALQRALASDKVQEWEACEPTFYGEKVEGGVL